MVGFHLLWKIKLNHTLKLFSQCRLLRSYRANPTGKGLSSNHHFLGAKMCELQGVVMDRLLEMHAITPQLRANKNLKSFELV